MNRFLRFTFALLSILPCSSISVFSQLSGDIKLIHERSAAGHQADRWYFGDCAGLDFRGPEVVADLSNILINMPTSPAIIADSAGNILFSTTGRYIYNRLDTNMVNGDSLHGSYACTTPVLIIPEPGNRDQFYVLTLGRPKQTPGDTLSTRYGLEYNVVDMTLDSGLGTVTVKNKVLMEPEFSSKLTAVKHANGDDYWILVHRFDSDEFCAFLLNSSGIDSTFYVSSHIGSVHQGLGETNNAVGYMKFSPDGNKLALTVYGSGIIELFDFDRATGMVTNAISSGPVFAEAYGIEFSPDSKYLYVSSTSTSLPTPGYTPPSHLFQFDLDEGVMIFTEEYYDTIATDITGSYFGGMQLGTDGRIYVNRAPYGSEILSIIANPVRPGQDCNLVNNGIHLGGRSCLFGFPNFISSYFNLPHFDIEGSGSDEITTFSLNNYDNIDSLLWNFGDPSSNQNTSKEFHPSHSFTASGTYEVSVIEYFNGKSFGPYYESVTVVLNDIEEEQALKAAFSKIYPNPGNGKLQISFYENFDEVKVVLKDGAGHDVRGPFIFFNIERNEEICLDINDLTPGLYFIIFTEEKGITWMKEYLLVK